jgi:hypothetical protein
MTLSKAVWTTGIKKSRSNDEIVYYSLTFSHITGAQFWSSKLGYISLADSSEFSLPSISQCPEKQFHSIISGEFKEFKRCQTCDTNYEELVYDDKASRRLY